MKKISIIVMALAFLAALTQCKKEQAIPANDSEGVAITLDIKGNGGTRVDVNTGTGTVTYQNGDVIYVASGGKYVGTLTSDGNRFAGTLTDPVEGEPLHFYFLGNVTPAEILTAGTTQTCSVVISDQTQRLPVIEYAPSEQNYTGGTNHYTAMLLNKCALVKFNVTTSSEAATCITGFNNKVTVDFSNNTLTPSKEGTGIIQLPAGSGEKWAILLPQEAMEEGEAGSAYSVDGTCTGTCGAVPAIYDNGYLTAGISVVISGSHEPVDPALSVPLTLEALTDGTIVVDIIAPFGKGGGVYPGSSKGGPGGGRSSNVSVTYSVNGGETHTITTTTTIEDLVAGDRVQFYGNGPDLINYYVPNIAGGTAQVKVYGNIMSMLDEHNYATLTTLQPAAFSVLFGGNANLTDASGLLLPATTLAEMCYFGMFGGCTSLTKAPALPATDLAAQCYYYMFYGCTSLTTAPTLPATTLAGECYVGMFAGCTSLNSVTCLATDISADGCTNGWLDGVATTGTFTKASGATWPEGANGIPSGWTVNEQ